MMTRTTRARAGLLLMLVAVFLLAMTAQAFGALAARGPVKATPPGQGFPMWYRDTAGTALELNIGPVNSSFSPVDPASPASVARGFGEEAFYWSAESTMNLSSGPATMTLQLRANSPQGVNDVSYSLRIDADVPVTGTYTVTHPFGVVSQNVLAAGVGGLDITDDGLTTGFDQVLARPVGPFLKSTSAPAGFLGDAVTRTTVTGSPNNTNFFRIQGPAGSGIGGPGIDFMQVNLFKVQGKIDMANSIDMMAPMVFSTVQMIPGTGTVTLTGTDALSGVAQLAYHIDRNPAVVVPGATATFSIKPGQHTVTFWGFDKAGNKSIPQTITVQVKGKPNLTLPKISPASPRRNRTFTISGKIGHADVGPTRVSFVIQRRVGNRWVAHKTVRATLVTGKKTFSAKTKINRRGTFRVRTTHAEDAVHLKGVSKFKTFRIR